MQNTNYEAGADVDTTDYEAGADVDTADYEAGADVDTTDYEAGADVAPGKTSRFALGYSLRLASYCCRLGLGLQLVRVMIRVQPVN